MSANHFLQRGVGGGLSEKVYHSRHGCAIRVLDLLGNSLRKRIETEYGNHYKLDLLAESLRLDNTGLYRLCGL